MNKLIHRFWGGDAMPDDYIEYGLKWQALNPDWTVVEWRTEREDTPYVGSSIDVHKVINEAVWKSIGSPPSGMRTDTTAMWTQRADMVSYEILYRYGGLYVNTDIEPVRPLTLMLSDDKMSVYPAAAMEDDTWLVNSAMWAPHEHSPFFKEVMDRLPERYFSMPQEYMNVTTGPHLLTHVASYTPIVALDKSVFSHIHWSQVPPGQDASFVFDDLPESTIGVHHWGHRKNQRPQTSWIGK
jgi:mannosyltransferase OCH1-like enzyme